MSLLFQKDDLILFQGASVTAASRDYGTIGAYGNGYVYFTASWLWGMYPALTLQVLNRGVPGNTCQDLLDRWQQDCIDLQPQWVSILNGMNDALQQQAAGHSDPYTFANQYRELIRWTLADTKAKIIILESFNMDVSPDAIARRPYIDPIITATRQVAMEFPVLFQPLDGLFAQGLTEAPAGYWTQDGIHPFPPGHGLIQQAFLRRAGGGGSFYGGVGP